MNEDGKQVNGNQPAAKEAPAPEADSLLDMEAPAPAPDAAKPNGTPPEKPAVGFVFDEKGVDGIFGKAGEDGRPSKVAAKYWDADKKAIKGDVLLTSALWMESKLGKSLEILGAPPEGTNYEIKVPDNLPVEIPSDDPTVQGFFAIARKHDVSQAFVNEVVAEVAKNIAGAKATNLDAERALLGDNGPQRIKDMGDFLKANLPRDEATVAANMIQSAAALQVFEKLLGKAMPPKFAAKEGDVTHVTTQEQLKQQWQERYFATNEQGQRLMSIDPDYARITDELRDRAFGTVRRDGSGRVMNG